MVLKGHSPYSLITPNRGSLLLEWILLPHYNEFFKMIPFLLGRIVNRFSKDLDIVDVNIPMTIRMWLGTGSGVFTTLFVISYSTPLFLIVIIPLGIMYYFVQVSTLLVHLCNIVSLLYR